jgi:RNA polymerase sigma-70 factor (ECF subfamily)
MIGDRERAEDLVQEAFIRVYRHLHRFDTTKKEGRSYEEIAELTRCNLGTVKSRLNRARHSFAERITPYLD